MTFAVFNHRKKKREFYLVKNYITFLLRLRESKQRMITSLMSYLEIQRRCVKVRLFWTEYDQC